MIRKHNICWLTKWLLFILLMVLQVYSYIVCVIFSGMNISFIFDDGFSNVFLPIAYIVIFTLHVFLIPVMIYKWFRSETQYTLNALLGLWILLEMFSLPFCYPIGFYLLAFYAPIAIVLWTGIILTSKVLLTDNNLEKGIQDET